MIGSHWINVAALVRLAACLAWIASISFSSPAYGCNIPVFRYALERWPTDAIEILVIHSVPLETQQSQWIADAARRGVDQGGSMKLTLHTIDVSKPEAIQRLPQARREIVTRAIDASVQADNASVPQVVLRRLGASDGPGVVWHGTITQAMETQWFQSPARTKIQKRLLAGDAIVWMVYKSEDEQRNRQIRELLEQQFEKLASQIKLPDGIGLPGSELVSEVPLLIQFSIVEIDPDDRQEAYLKRTLRDRLGSIQTTDTPLVVPVFGRARALEIIPADDLNASLIQSLTRFLCGACSCQVKELNPGFDLLLDTDWQEELFGDQTPPLDTPLHQRENLPPLVIPSGRSPAGSE